MPRDLATLPIYHITAIANLPSILRSGYLASDAQVSAMAHEVIGYGHIKQRRLTQYRVDCCNNRFVGEFVPFYFCPRSVMLFVVNKGRIPGKPAGCQADIVHLVSTVAIGMGLGRPWAISDGNAGADHTSFSDDPATIETLDWNAIQATNWSNVQHEKAAEFLVADRFPWTAVTEIGCHSEAAAVKVRNLIAAGSEHRPLVARQADWYYP